MGLVGPKSLPILFLILTVLKRGAQHQIVITKAPKLSASVRALGEGFSESFAESLSGVLALPHPWESAGSRLMV